MNDPHDRPPRSDRLRWERAFAAVRHTRPGCLPARRGWTSRAPVRRHRGAGPRRILGMGRGSGPLLVERRDVPDLRTAPGLRADLRGVLRRSCTPTTSGRSGAAGSTVRQSWTATTSRTESSDRTARSRYVHGRRDVRRARTGRSRICSAPHRMSPSSVWRRSPAGRRRSCLRRRSRRRPSEWR